MLSTGKKFSRNNSKALNHSKDSLKNIAKGRSGTVRLDEQGRKQRLHSQLRKKAIEILPSDVSYPLSPEAARMLFFEYLNKHEKEEIFNYSDIYFVGQVTNKDLYDKVVESEGYDNKKGSYRVVAVSYTHLTLPTICSV
eukprot:TRINITY_DN20987_c0_g2_i1.p1 TRINITY_DN20987_c0_g2~~TRINITY_DN20987_c0_g2_i1.p1  ORF type:complete len:139 (+),score=22.66 TRINITY_DN20987_c0_g2_i1:275-691(+)